MSPRSSPKSIQSRWLHVRSPFERGNDRRWRSIKSLRQGRVALNRRILPHFANENSSLLRGMATAVTARAAPRSSIRSFRRCPHSRRARICTIPTIFPLLDRVASKSISDRLFLFFGQCTLRNICWLGSERLDSDVIGPSKPIHRTWEFRPSRQKFHRRLQWAASNRTRELL
jgi:hypothetical protein